jgi:predicted kinase
VLSEKPTLFLTCGLPGSGKTTIARRIEKEYSAVRLTADEWLSKLRPHHPSRERDDFRPAVESIQLELTERLLTLGCNVVLDWGLWAKVERDQYRTLARHLDAHVVLCVTDLSLEQLRVRLAERNANRRENEFHISDEDLERALSFWQPPTQDELELFDPMT